MERYTQNHAHLFIKLLVVILEFCLLSSLFRPILQVLFSYSYIEFEYIFPVEVLLALVWIGIGSILGLYHYESIFQLRYLRPVLTWTILLTVAFSYLVILMYGVITFPIHTVLISFLLSAAIIAGIRIILGLGYKYRRLLFFVPDHNVMIIGAGEVAMGLQSFFKSHKAGEVYRVMEQETSGLDDEAVLNLVRERSSEIKSTCLQKEVKEIYYTLPLNGSDVIEDMAQFADNNYIYFRVANDFKFLSNRDFNVAFFNQTPIISLRKDPLASFLNRLLKRAFDILFSFLVICTAMPIVYLFIGLLIKLDSKGPVLFLQNRSGRNNRIFKCYKFRTMYVQTESDTQEYKQATQGDPRITRVGRFLRRSNLDEFPQFLNVLLGHMSVVGPRPHPPKLNDQYIPIIKNYPFRYFITPGITGQAQVNGYRGETKNPKEMEMRVKYDAWYIENWTFWLDLKIIFRTFFNMVKGNKGVY